MRMRRKRNLYWICNAELLVAFFVVAMAAMIAYLQLSNSGDMMELRETFASIPIVGMFFIVIAAGYTGVTSHLQVALSFGATRKECFAGIEIMLHVCAVELAIIAGICNLLAGEVYAVESGMYVMNSMTIMFFAVAIGNLVAASTAKWGKGIGVLVILLVAALAVASLVWLLISSDIIEQKWLVFVAGAIDGITIPLVYLGTRKTEVIV